MLRSVLSLMKMASFNALAQLLNFADILYFTVYGSSSSK